MYSFRQNISPVMVGFHRPFFALTIALVISLMGMGAVSPGSSLADDNIGIFWDTDYVQDATAVTSFPGILTGYLVIKDPSIPHGIVAWEMCVEVDGPAQLLSWDLAGDAINANTPPCFSVGIGPGPLRSDRDVLLATFQIMVTDVLPVSISVLPSNNPGVPDQISYVPYNTGTFVPLTTLSGQPEVAFVNDPAPHLAVNPSTLHFDDAPIGLEIVQTLTVTNFGGAPGQLDIALAANGCDMFSLPGVSGPVTLNPGESVEIDVSCNALTPDPFACSLILGGGLNDVPLVGNGYEAVIAWEAPTELDFDAHAIGSTVTRGITVRNVGDVAFDLTPSLVQPCPEFAILSGGHSSPVAPGSQRTVYMTFNPVALGTFTCALDLGPVVPAVNLIGIGRDPILNWTITPASLDFGPIGVGATPQMAITISNVGEGPFTVAPVLPGTCDGFVVAAGGTPVSLDPGFDHVVTIQFAPLAEGVDYACTLDLGETLPDVPVAGSGQVSVIDWDAPTAHDFGAVGVGLIQDFNFTVTNTGNVGFLVDPVMAGNAQEFSLGGGHATFLHPGDIMGVVVFYQPLSVGLHTGVLDLGTTVPPIQLTGEGTPRPAAWTVAPRPLDFGWNLIGSTEQKSVVVTNTGGTVLDLDVNLERLDLGYSVISGGGVSQLGIGLAHEVVVQFEPLIDALLQTTLNLGPEVGGVQVTGWGQDPGNVCAIQPSTLAFGPISVGNTQTKTYTVTNNGITSIVVSPVSDSPEFVSSGGARNLAPGQTVYYSVMFTPLGPGSFSGTISLGSEFCGELTMTGEATTTTGPGQDMVGIFFDPAFTLIEAQTFGLNEIVEGYLVLVEPSQTSGVGAWEMAVSINGDAQWLSWVLEGQNINVGTYDDFIVGIGGSPLPYAPSIKLATFQILIPRPYPSIVYLELGPVQTPSIPGQMAWAPWHDPSMLLPLYPFTGNRIVAGINWGSVVGIGNPAPLARITGGEIALEWPIPENPGDGCHVYRRDQTGPETRLTTQPVTGFGASLNFTDHPTGYADGTVLYYSYSVVTGGVEGPRSPETEIKLTGIPVVTTRLLPNVPNPFNPLTEVRFELSKPQQTRVAIYDVTGRLVKVLADGYLEAGPHGRTWLGKDNGGRQVPSGVYYVRLVADGRVDHHKMMLLK